MIDFYEHKNMKEFLTQYQNPHFDIHQVRVPFWLAVIAASGSGKTQWLLNLIANMQDTFGHIYIWYSASELLYEFMQIQIVAETKFITQLAKFPLINEMPKDKQILCVFDDVLNYSDKVQGVIKDCFILGRKLEKSISNYYLSQSFFIIPKIIRFQCN